MIQVGEEIGFSEEMSWLKEILSWPSEWSALHGIAEVKTPILKVSTRTDATARKYIVRRTSTQYPAEAATGLGFPYRSSEQTMLTDSRSFHHGIENIIRFREPVPNWRHLDNGFTSFHMMEQLHKPIVDLARDVIGEAGGTVMDFGCGNGSLLEKICRGRQEIIPFGIDRNTLALQHAALLLPEYRANFIGADLFDVNAWSSPRRYALGIFMAGRLIENPGAHTLHFLSAVRDSCEHLLVYVYPGWSEDSLIEIVRKAGLRILRHSNGGMVALVSVP